MYRILAIGAHPDDVEIGCAGLLQRASDTHIVILTGGGQGGILNRRINEAKQAAKLLNADVSFGHQPDTQIDHRESIVFIESAIDQFQPDLILTMTKNDIHQDHRVAYTATRSAARNTTCTILSYTTPSSAENFHPTWFVPLTERDMNLKLAAIACHSSQAHRLYLSKEYIIGMARYWAMVTRSNYNYVEQIYSIKRKS